MNAVTASEVVPEGLVYPRERVLGAVTLVLGLLVWLALIVGTVGVALVLLALAHSHTSLLTPL
jgi:hypothetical protein